MKTLPTFTAALLSLAMLLPVQAAGTRGETTVQVRYDSYGPGQAELNQSTGWGYPGYPQAGNASAANVLYAGNGASASASAEYGVLRASAWASFPSRQSQNILGQPLYGGAYANGSALFDDSWLVSGPGLALGTPVNLVFTLHIHGLLSAVTSQYGTPLVAGANLQMQARDWVEPTRYFNWDSNAGATGNYQWLVPTAVGRTLSLQAQFGAFARLDNWAFVDAVFANYRSTVRLYMAPSIAGISTVSLGGHDYALPAVPEPATLALWVLGLLVVVQRTARRAAAAQAASAFSR